MCESPDTNCRSTVRVVTLHVYFMQYTRLVFPELRVGFFWRQAFVRDNYPFDLLTHKIMYMYMTHGQINIRKNSYVLNVYIIYWGFLCSFLQNLKTKTDIIIICTYFSVSFIDLNFCNHIRTIGLKWTLILRNVIDSFSVTFMIASQAGHK